MSVDLFLPCWVPPATPAHGKSDNSELYRTSWITVDPITILPAQFGPQLPLPFLSAALFQFFSLFLQISHRGLVALRQPRSLEVENGKIISKAHFEGPDLSSRRRHCCINVSSSLDVCVICGIVEMGLIEGRIAQGISSGPQIMYEVVKTDRTDLETGLTRMVNVHGPVAIDSLLG